MRMSITITPRSFAAFAAGIVVAVLATLVVDGWSADAAPGDDDATFVPIAPCRLFDFRPGDPNVGPRDTPLRADETYELQVSGTNGDCVLPDDIDAVSLNVTIVGPTAASHLTLYPADSSRPNASNLNWVAGQAATPNKVDVKVSSSGAIEMYNPFGEVFVLADVNGYYTDDSLDEIEQRLSVLEITSTTVGSSGDPTDLTQLPVDGAIVEVASFDLEAPGAGSLVVHSSATASDQSPGAKIFCTISDAVELQAPFQAWESAGNDGSIGQLAGTRVFDVAAGNHTIWLVCQSATGSIDPALGNVSGAVLSYVFVPD